MDGRSSDGTSGRPRRIPRPTPRRPGLAAIAVLAGGVAGVSCSYNDVGLPPAQEPAGPSDGSAGVRDAASGGSIAPPVPTPPDPRRVQAGPRALRRRRRRLRRRGRRRLPGGQRARLHRWAPRVEPHLRQRDAQSEHRRDPPLSVRAGGDRRHRELRVRRRLAGRDLREWRVREDRTAMPFRSSSRSSRASASSRSAA